MAHMFFKIYFCAIFFIVITARENTLDTKLLNEKVFNIFNRNANLYQPTGIPDVNSTEIIGPDDPCYSQPCLNDGECKPDMTKLGAYKCECKPWFSGKNCETKCVCKRGECVVNEYGKAVCQCPPEYGHYTPSECMECNCGEGSNCTYGYYGGKTCICKEGYGEKSGKCKECNCGEGVSNCTFSYYGDGKTCNCKDGYGEKNGKCKKCYCGQNAGCRFDENGNKICSCLKGYRYINGKCRDPCIPNPCQNGGKCKVEYVDYTCTCKFPYSGRNCEKDCGCENGTCVEDEFGETVCQCPPGFGLYLNKTCKACECGGGASCEFEGSGAAIVKTCFCKEGYKNIMNVCKECYCGPASSCFFENYNIKRCICPDGLMEINGTCKDPCNPNPCRNRGKCQLFNGRYSCACIPPYSGRTCEIDCSCGPNGKCSLDIHGNKQCYCRSGFVEFEGLCKEDKKENIVLLVLLGTILAATLFGIFLLTCVLCKNGPAAQWLSPRTAAILGKVGSVFHPISGSRKLVPSSLGD